VGDAVGEAVGDAVGEAVGDALGEAVGDALGVVDGGVLFVAGTVRSKVLSAPVPSSRGSALWSFSSAERNVESAIVTTTTPADTTGVRTAVRG